MLKSGSKTDSQFNTLNYNLFAATWSQLGRELIAEYDLSMTDLRLLTAVGALIELYSWSLNGGGISCTQVSKITGFAGHKITGRLKRLSEMGYLTEDIEQYGKRTIKRYKLTKTGKTMLNKISGDMDKVHERIIDYLYSKKLLKH